VYEKARLVVLVDDLPNPSRRDLIPAHGLSLYVDLKGDGGRFTILFDTGPSLELLVHNANTLNISPLSPCLVFLSVWLRHHVGGFVEALRRGMVKWEETIAPEFPGLRNRPPASGRLPPGTRIIGPYGRWFREQALAIEMDRGWLVITGCCVYGITKLITLLNTLQGKVYALVGGLNLSALDVLDGPALLKWAKRAGIEMILPLHSTGPRARKIILSRFGNGLKWSGVGLDVEL